MTREHVHSTTIRSLGYSAPSRTLEIEFVSGAVYRYADVPHDTYAALKTSQSKGQHFNDRIRNHFRHTRVAQ